MKDDMLHLRHFLRADDGPRLAAKIRDALAEVHDGVARGFFGEGQAVALMTLKTIHLRQIEAGEDARDFVAAGE